MGMSDQACSDALRASWRPRVGYRPGEHDAEPFVGDVPLEALVERRPVPLARGGREIALDVRLVMGRQWLRMTAGIGDHADDFVARYPVDPPAPGDADRLAHPEAWRAYAAAAGRLMDGGKLRDHLTAAAGNRAYDGIAGIAPADQSRLDEQAARFLAWYDRLIAQPPARDAWTPERLEYRFACAAPTRYGRRGDCKQCPAPRRSVPVTSAGRGRPLCLLERLDQFV